MVGRGEVFAALARLPAEQREVLVFRFYGDLSVAETAVATGTSQGTVKSRTSRELARMRKLLAGPVQPTSQPTLLSRLVMMTDEQLIERIRTGLNDELAGLHPPADLLDRLLSAPGAQRRLARWLPSGFGGALATVASVAVVGLVVVAITTVGHRRSPSSPISSVPVGVPAGARALVARLAVLRRPQDAADRLPGSVIAQEASSGGAVRIIPGLTRLAATASAGPGPLAAVEIYVVVGRPSGYPGDIVARLEVAGRSGHRYLFYPANVPPIEIAVPSGALTPSAVASPGDLARWVNVRSSGSSGAVMDAGPLVRPWRRAARKFAGTCHRVGARRQSLL